MKSFIFTAPDEMVIQFDAHVDDARVVLHALAAYWSGEMITFQVDDQSFSVEADTMECHDLIDCGF